MPKFHRTACTYALVLLDWNIPHNHVWCSCHEPGAGLWMLMICMLTQAERVHCHLPADPLAGVVCTVGHIPYSTIGGMGVQSWSGAAFGMLRHRMSREVSAWSLNVDIVPPSSVTYHAGACFRGFMDRAYRISFAILWNELGRVFAVCLISIRCQEAHDFAYAHDHDVLVYHQRLAPTFAGSITAWFNRQLFELGTCHDPGGEELTGGLRTSPPPQTRLGQC